MYVAVFCFSQNMQYYTLLYPVFSGLAKINYRKVYFYLVVSTEYCIFELVRNT